MPHSLKYLDQCIDKIIRVTTSDTSFASSSLTLYICFVPLHYFIIIIINGRPFRAVLGSQHN